jgi:hypothetical protein
MTSYRHVTKIEIVKKIATYGILLIGAHMEQLAIVYYQEKLFDS